MLPLNNTATLTADLLKGTLQKDRVTWKVYLMLYPDWRMRTVSSIPVYLSCLSTRVSLKRNGNWERDRERVNLRRKKKNQPLPITRSSVPLQQKLPSQRWIEYTSRNTAPTDRASPSAYWGKPANTNNWCHILNQMTTRKLIDVIG